MSNDTFITFLPILVNAAILCGVIYFVWRVISRRTKQNDKKVQQIMMQNTEMKAALEKLLSEKEAGKEE